MLFSGRDPVQVPFLQPPPFLTGPTDVYTDPQSCGVEYTGKWILAVRGHESCRALCCCFLWSTAQKNDCCALLKMRVPRGNMGLRGQRGECDRLWCCFCYSNNAICYHKPQFLGGRREMGFLLNYLSLIINKNPLQLVKLDSQFCGLTTTIQPQSKSKYFTVASNRNCIL